MKKQSKRNVWLLGALAFVSFVFIVAILHSIDTTFHHGHERVTQNQVLNIARETIENSIGLEMASIVNATLNVESQILTSREISNSLAESLNGVRKQRFEEAVMNYISQPDTGSCKSHVQFGCAGVLRSSIKASDFGVICPVQKQTNGISLCQDLLITMHKTSECHVLAVGLLDLEPLASLAENYKCAVSVLDDRSRLPPNPAPGVSLFSVGPTVDNMAYVKGASKGVVSILIIQCAGCEWRLLAELSKRSKNSNLIFQGVRQIVLKLTGGFSSAGLLSLSKIIEQNDLVTVRARYDDSGPGCSLRKSPLSFPSQIPGCLDVTFLRRSDTVNYQMKSPLQAPPPNQKNSEKAMLKRIMKRWPRWLRRRYEFEHESAEDPPPSSSPSPSSTPPPSDNPEGEGERERERERPAALDGGHENRLEDGSGEDMAREAGSKSAESNGAVTRRGRGGGGYCDLPVLRVSSILRTVAQGSINSLIVLAAPASDPTDGPNSDATGSSEKILLLTSREIISNIGSGRGQVLTRYANLEGELLTQKIFENITDVKFAKSELMCVEEESAVFKPLGPIVLVTDLYSQKSLSLHKFDNFNFALEDATALDILIIDILIGNADRQESSLLKLSVADRHDVPFVIKNSNAFATMIIWSHPSHFVNFVKTFDGLGKAWPWNTAGTIDAICKKKSVLYKILSDLNREREIFDRARHIIKALSDSLIEELTGSLPDEIIPPNIHVDPHPKWLTELPAATMEKNLFFNFRLPAHSKRLVEARRREMKDILIWRRDNLLPALRKYFDAKKALEPARSLQLIKELGSKKALELSFSEIDNLLSSENTLSDVQKAEIAKASSILHGFLDPKTATIPSTSTSFESTSEIVTTTPNEDSTTTATPETTASSSTAESTTVEITRPVVQGETRVGRRAKHK